MRTSLIALVTLALASTAALAEGPQINIPQELLSLNQIGADQERQLDAYASYWLGQLATANTDAARVAAATAIAEGYRKYDNAAYRTAYAAALNKNAAPAVAKFSKPAGTIGALTLSEIHEPGMQNTLDAMVRDKNDAVRYLGWRGYLAGNLRATLLAAPISRKQMLTSLGERAAKEESPAVIGAIADALRMPPVPPELLADKDYKAIQAQCRQFLQAMWPRICQRVVAGDAEMALAAERALESAEYFWAPDDAKEKTRSLQNIVDMMYCAVLAYDATGGKGQAAEAAGQLAIDAEGLLMKLTNTGKADVQKALGLSEVSARGLAAREAVLGWVDALKPQGVVKPSIKAPATQPAAPGV